MAQTRKKASGGARRGSTVRNDTGRDAMITAPRIDDLSHDQHARKGQAESPRERTLNQPEKKKHRGGRSGGR